MPDPSVNTMDFVQAATLLNSIYAQATGKTSIAATSTADFTAQAQATLQTGYDAVSSSISGLEALHVRALRELVKGLLVSGGGVDDVHVFSFLACVF